MRIKFLNTLGVIGACLCMAACANDAETSDVARSIDLSSVEVQIVEQNYEYALAAFDAISKEHPADNLVFCPLSASMDMSMLANGANGKTQTEILDLLNCGGMDVDVVNGLNHKLLKELPTIDKNVNLQLHNSLWLNDQISVNKEFRRTVEKEYAADVYVCPTEKMSEQINDWCVSHSNGLISQLPVLLFADMQAALINLTYFKANWSKEYKFSKSSTSRKRFIDINGEEQVVPFMCKQTDYAYLENDICRMASIPFGNGNFLYTIILPQEGKTLDECVSAFSKQDLDAIAEGDKLYLNLCLPKYTVTSLLSLKKSMPVDKSDALFSLSADFGNIHKDFFLSDVVQQSVFSIDETGAVSASVTGDLIATAPMAIPFVVDRPFAFVVWERTSGCVLYVGKIVTFDNQ